MGGVVCVVVVLCELWVCGVEWEGLTVSCVEVEWVCEDEGEGEGSM